MSQQAKVATTDEFDAVQWIVQAPGSWWLAPATAALVLQLTWLGGRAHLDGHEVLVAQTAREMLATGDWLVPRFAGEPRYQKPPLPYWLSAGCFWLTGASNAFTARLPAALAAVLGVVFLAWFTRGMLGPKAGLVAGLVQATTVWNIEYGKNAVVDVLLTTLVTGAILAAAADRLERCRPPSWLACLAFWTFAGLAVLAKGPVALAVIFPTAMLYRMLRERRPDDRPCLLHPAALLGLPIFFALSLGWPAALYPREPAVLQIWQAQSVDRFVSHWGPNTRPWFYYLYEVPLLTLPWFPLWLIELVGLVRERRQHRLRQDDLRLLALCWFGVGLVFFSLSQGKRAHYILPVLPALTLLATLGLARAARMIASWLEPREGLVQWLVALATVLAIPLFLLLAIVLDLDSHLLFTGPCLVLAGGLATSGLVAWGRRPEQPAPAALLFVALAVGILIVETVWTPSLRWRSSAQALFDRNRDLLRAVPQVLQFGSNDRWAIFPLDVPMSWPRSADDLARELTVQPNSLILVAEDRLDAVRQTLRCEIVDRTTEPLSLGERTEHRQLVLLRPLPAMATRE